MDARLLFPKSVRRLPADLAAVMLVTLLTNVFVFTPYLRETPVRVVLGLFFVLFVPGYAFIAALFPEAGAELADAAVDDDGHAGTPEDERDINGLERVTLSLGTSIAIVPLIGLVLNFTPFGIRLVPIVASVSLFTLGCVGVGARRRWRLPEAERLTVPYRQWIAGVRTELFEPNTRGDAVLNVVMVVSILLAVTTVGYAVLVPKDGESFTELYLLTQNDSGGLVADDYPTSFTVGEGQSLYVGIGNHEHEPVNYTVVVELQRVDVQYFENGARVSNVTNSTNVTNVSVEVLEAEELQRFTPTVASNETWQQQHTVTPTLTGERLRLVYLLYKGEVPTDPTTENAYREVHLWVNVSRSGEG